MTNYFASIYAWYDIIEQNAIIILLLSDYLSLCLNHVDLKTKLQKVISK
jgi:hypothetical protein